MSENKNVQNNELSGTHCAKGVSYAYKSLYQNIPQDDELI